MADIEESQEESRITARVQVLPIILESFGVAARLGQVVDGEAKEYRHRRVDLGNTRRVTGPCREVGDLQFAWW